MTTADARPPKRTGSQGPGSRPPCEAVLLDLDGTLVLSEEVHRLAWQALFDTWGVEVTDADYEQQYMGRRPSDVIAGVPGPWTGADAQAVLSTMTAFTLEHAGSVEVVPGAAALIRRLRVKYPVAVITSAGALWAQHLLDKVLGVRHLVDVVITAEDTTSGKPSPEGYLRACTALRARPAHCLAFEDSPSGVTALVAAGVRDIVGVTTTTASADLTLAGARWTVPDLTAASVRSISGALRAHSPNAVRNDEETEA
ncbi:HAD family hydrolase [Streptomyces wuyuanensis]|uniref:Sugar-phosphatase n=1 Tax=Streptomyces wuyuanensis TaxID=1196353 RepID=A0A1H0A2M9_9ACTN|nr:HAD family phosphatase [Streptomyces wuyuanensis]SDN27471.1 sugar-phosphatase [Streptomyces wuyuanensis]